MANMEQLQTFDVICEGGLDSNQNFLSLSARSPGVAINLYNFEPSLAGGYRRINGYRPLEFNNQVVDPSGGEGKILGLAIFGDDIIAARKQLGSNTYKFYQRVPSNPWVPYTTGLTLNSNGSGKVRHCIFNFDAADSILFTDGDNPATLFDGTTWAACDSADTGTDIAHAGGNQALDAPKFCTVFKNHIFVSGDATAPQVVAHSAPSKAFDWTVANGAGQLVMSFEVKQIKPFRDELYVFGETQICKIVVNGTTFVVQDVTKTLGCLAPDSVVEINGDLQFLSQDGFRTVAGTNRINDVELATLSKNIQRDVTFLIQNSNFESVNSVVIRQKSQVRHFFSNEFLVSSANEGIIGGLKLGNNGFYWEWGKLRGIKTSCVVSAYIGNTEYVLHGDFDGSVYRQEVGNSFNGEPITAIYQTPYLDFGDVFTRKTIHKLFLFIKPEGNLSLSIKVNYNWGDETMSINPLLYNLQFDSLVDLYGEGVYGTAAYASTPISVSFKNIEGSGMSNSLTFSSRNLDDPYSIQGFVYEFEVNGRK